jgi:hypothetical protein
MAEMFIERWRLAVLRVRLDVSQRAPRVIAELAGYPEGTEHTLWRREYPPTAFGLLGGTAVPRTLSVPTDLRDAVARSMNEDLDREAALWLRLVPPYGYLGAVPWEEELVSGLGLPIVRVPNRLPVAADPGHVWSVAIAINAPPGSIWAASYISAFLSALRSAVSAKIDVAVFADAATHKDVKAHLRETAEDPEVHVHDPANAKQAYDERSARSAPQSRLQRRDIRIRSSAQRPGILWADWITAGLAGRAVRALHVVADATFDADRPLLAVSPDPRQSADRSNCAYVDPDGVAILADAVGAAAVSFGSPPDNPSDIATRVMADAVGQQRPGATLYSSLKLDSAGYALAQAHAFIANNEPGRVAIPRDPSLFAYLPPESVKDSLREPWPAEELLLGVEDRPGVSTPSPDLGTYAQADVVPTWLAASERYIDSNVARLAATSAIEGEASPTRKAYESGTEDALAELRALVAKHARKA